MRRRRSLSLLIGLPLVILACNLFSPGAAKTVETFMYAVEKGNIDEARNLCSAGLQAMLGPKLGVALAALGETVRQRGGIKSIETTERVVGETATVQATIKYGNGQSEQTQTALIKENGVWRISQ